MLLLLLKNIRLLSNKYHRDGMISISVLTTDYFACSLERRARQDKRQGIPSRADSNACVCDAVGRQPLCKRETTHTTLDCTDWPCSKHDYTDYPSTSFCPTRLDDLWLHPSAPACFVSLHARHKRTRRQRRKKKSVSPSNHPLHYIRAWAVLARSSSLSSLKTPPLLLHTLSRCMNSQVYVRLIKTLLPPPPHFRKASRSLSRKLVLVRRRSVGEPHVRKSRPRE